MTILYRKFKRLFIYIFDLFIYYYFFFFLNKYNPTRGDVHRVAQRSRMVVRGG
jgi:hypothetical protein